MIDIFNRLTSKICFQQIVTIIKKLSIICPLNFFSKNNFTLVHGYTSVENAQLYSLQLGWFLAQIWSELFHFWLCYTWVCIVGTYVHTVRYSSRRYQAECLIIDSTIIYHNFDFGKISITSKRNFSREQTNFENLAQYRLGEEYYLERQITFPKIQFSGSYLSEKSSN